LFHVHELEYTYRSLEFDQQIYVAIFPRLASHGRAKESQRFDAQPIEVRLASAQDLKDLFLSTPILIHICLFLIVEPLIH